MTRLPFMPDSRSGGAASSGELRQVTILFCDLVDSTRLSSSVDPETEQIFNRTYGDVCAGCIERCKGTVKERQGDGVVAYFGFPHALEDGIERAITAAMDIIESVAQLIRPDSERAQVRIGIATGQLAVDVDGDSAGPSKNLAARLKDIAKPGDIVVTDDVRRSAVGDFLYEDLGEVELKGLPGKTRAWKVPVIDDRTRSFEQRRQRGLTPFVGRERQFELLQERWRAARRGNGQVVVLCGDAGIGKSRLAHELRQKLEASREADTMTFQCSEYHLESPFYPAISNLERTLKFQPDTPGDVKLERLHDRLATKLGRPVEDIHLIASLLSIPAEHRFGPLELTPKLRKQRTIEALVSVIEASARQRPTMMLFEDLHWNDATTIETLEALIERVRGIPLLLVITCRPAKKPERSRHPRPGRRLSGWADRMERALASERRLSKAVARWRKRDYVKALRISALTSAATDRMIVGLAAGRTLPAALRRQITDKTAGIPLWVEEWTKSVLDDLERNNRSGHRGRVTVPRSIYESLRARLDRLRQPVKKAARIGSSIGREFTSDLLAKVTSTPARRVDSVLEELEKSGLVRRRRAASTFVFKHALIQDVAYDSLLPSDRRKLHGRIAAVLERHFPGKRDTEPQVLAQHYTEAGLYDKAVAYWHRSGELSMKRFALSEAIAQLRTGLELVERLPAGDQRQGATLNLYAQLGPALVAEHGWASRHVRNSLEPAWAAAKRSLGSGDPHAIKSQAPNYLAVLNLEWVYFLTIGRLVKSMEWAETMLEVAEQCDDSNLTINAHRSLMASHFWMGNFIDARAHADEIERTYDADAHASIVKLTNTDPMTMAGIYRSHFLWMLGYPDQALAECGRKNRQARDRKHPFDLAFALTLGSHAYDYCGDVDGLLNSVEEVKKLGRERGILLMSEIMAELVHGVASFKAGRIDESIAQLKTSIQNLSETGQTIYVTYLRAVLAEARIEQGAHDIALELVDESLRRIELQKERVHEAEVRRVKARALLKLGNVDAAEQELNVALNVARDQRARSWELRVAMTYAESLRARGETTRAYRLVQPIYEWFTEGFDTADLIRARQLLRNLREPRSTAFA